MYYVSQVALLLPCNMFFLFLLLVVVLLMLTACRSPMVPLDSNLRNVMNNMTAQF